MQQATVNLFADMGVQPAILQADLMAASNSTDMVAPTSVITSPPDGSTVQIGRSITITGTAIDTDGVVGNVEVSVDGGITWHPASGNTNWSYSWRPSKLGSSTIMSDTAGYIIGVRFYKGDGNRGPHVGHLWTDTGATLAEADFTNETTTDRPAMGLIAP